MAGLHAGDKVVVLEGERNPNWEQAEKALTKLSANSKLSMEVEQAGVRRSLKGPVEQKDLEQPERPLVFVALLPRLGEVAPGRPPHRAGTQEKDVIAAGVA